jgi:CRISPR-associated protein Cst2
MNTSAMNLYSLSISARATLDLHSLNNEGGEGNQIQTRMVNIVDQSGRLHNVNAISGDMWKHIQAEHLFRLISEREDVPLCAGCREFNANRINADTAYVSYISNKETTDATATDELLTRCGMDDLEGNLITTGNRSLPRKSVSEFGWVVGLPEQTTTDSYFHVKYANERSGGRRQADREATEESGSNLGQAIFHRPTSSGVYAIVTVLELARIGFNDITQRYSIDQDQRRLRHAALLESLLYTFLEPRGAMRSTQNPHLVNFEGVIALSSSATPAPTVSPLKADYDEEIAAIQRALEPLRPGAITLLNFKNLAEFANHMTHLIEQTTPYTLHYA